MGGELDIVARFPDHSVKIRSFAGLTQDESAAGYRAQPAAGASAGGMAMILGKAGTTDAVLPGDEIPEDWLETPTQG